MENWKVELATGGRNPDEVKIQRGLLQRDTLATAVCYCNDTIHLHI